MNCCNVRIKIHDSFGPRASPGVVKDRERMKLCI